MKLLYSDKKTGMTASMELDEERAAVLLNSRIGGEVDGGAFGLSGYTLKITGGSDSSGFPLDRSVSMQGKTRVMRVQHRKRGAAVRRMMVRGNLITNDVKQVSAVITQYGSKPIEEVFPNAKKGRDPGVGGKAEGKAEEKADEGK